MLASPTTHLGSGPLFNLAPSDHADPALLLQLAALVVVGDAGGNPHAAGGGARTPLGGLGDAVGLRAFSFQAIVWSVSVIWVKQNL